MAYTSAVSAAVGESTKASTPTKLGANDDWLREKADAQHDFDVSTGDGSHKDIVPDADSSRDIGETSTPKRFANAYVDALGDSGADLSVNSSAVLKPNIPAFFAANSSSDVNVTGDGTTYTVQFDSERFDQGADYDAVDTFTAPVTGRYWLSAIVHLDGLASGHLVLLTLVTSNHTYRIGYLTDAGPVGSRISLGHPILADMDVGDTAIIQINVSGGSKTVDVMDTSYFCGILDA